MTTSPAIPFVDLGAQYRAHKDAIDAAIHRVLDHGRFIMGPEVAELEERLGTFTGAPHVVGCASGTDALQIILMAEGIGPGDAVFVPSFTFTATAEVIVLLGATPVFVDVDAASFNIDTADLAAKVADVRAAGALRPRAVIAVDLFGQPADYDTLQPWCAAEELVLIADAAQSLGASLGNGRVGTLGDATAASFFPAKPLGCYGDGGAVFTASAERADVLRSLRAHGKGGAKYDIERIGLNSRLDTMQAAILLAKLDVFEGEIEAREQLAQKYDAALGGTLTVPRRVAGARAAWAQYTLQCADRDGLKARLAEHGVPSAIYYPLPMHLQTAYREFGAGVGSLPVSERLSETVLSLPMHPYMDDATAERICAAVLASV